MEKSRTQTVWIVILAVALILTLLLAHADASKQAALSSKLSQVQNDNTAAQQQCIQQAQSVAAAAPTLKTTADNLSASVSACKAEYPTR